MNDVIPMKTKRPRGVKTPLAALQRTITRSSALAELMLTIMEKEMKNLKTAGKAGKTTQLQALLGPRGAIASLHKLVMILDKLGGQVEQMQRLASMGKVAEVQPLSREEMRLLEAWVNRID